MEHSTGERVVAVIARVFFGNDAKLERQDSFVDLGAGYMDGIRLAMALNREFDVDISDDDAKKMRTVGDTIDCVNNLLTGKRVVAIVAEQLGIRKSEAVREARFREDFGIDSLDEIELALQLSEDFDIPIPDEDAVGLLTVGDAIDYVVKKLSGPQLELQADGT